MDRKIHEIGNRMSMPISLFAAFALAVALPGQARGQAETVDEGTFQVTVRGQTVGTEAFSIVRRGDGDARRTLSHGQIRWDLAEGTQTMAPLLALEGAGLEISQYEMKATGGPLMEVRLERPRSRRLQATVISTEGEREQEFLFREGALVLEAGVAHHYHFVGERVRSGATSVLVLRPSLREQSEATIRAAGSEAVVVGGTSVPAQRYTLAMGGNETSIWFDDQGRLLRVEDPARSFVAVRRERP